jgi:lysophospholipase L1-like esterase
MRLLRTVLIMAFVTLFLFLLLEFGARLVLWRAEEVEVVRGGFGFSTTGSGDLLPNLNSIETVYALRPYRLVTNSVGLRNTEELNNDEDVTRILAIGDSFTYGFYVHNEEAYPARLEEVLEQSNTGRYQVLNAGVPGYTLQDELAYLNEKGLALNPDVVILGVYTNDIFDYMPQMRQYFARQTMMATASGTALSVQSPLSVWLRQNSALYNGLLSLRGQLSAAQIAQTVANVTPTIEGLEVAYHNITFLAPDTPDNQVHWQAYEADFRALVATLNERNIPLIVVLFPDLNQFPENGMPIRPQAFFAQLTQELNVPFVDMLPLFREQGTIQSLYLMYYDVNKPVNTNAPDAAVQAFTGDGHLSMYGHWLTAQALRERVREVVGR